MKTCRRFSLLLSLGLALATSSAVAPRLTHADKEVRPITCCSLKSIRRATQRQPGLLPPDIKIVRPADRKQARAAMRERGERHSRSVFAQLGLTEADVEKYGGQPHSKQKVSAL